MLHDLRLQVVASTPHSSSVKHLWSLRASGMWQALSTCWPLRPEFKVVAGHTCKDIALDRLAACFSLCINENVIFLVLQFMTLEPGLRGLVNLYLIYCSIEKLILFFFLRNLVCNWNKQRSWKNYSTENHTQEKKTEKFMQTLKSRGKSSLLRAT